MVSSHFEVADSDFNDYRVHPWLNITESPNTPNVSALEYFCCVLYGVLFFLGLISNGVVLRTLITVLRFRIRHPSRTSNGGRANNSILVYLVALCLVNVLVLAALPLTIADVGTGEWRLPVFFCSVYWLAETMNKIMTSMISASFSLSCYFSVCRFNVTQMYKSSLVAALILAAGFGVTCWQAKVALTYADVFHLLSEEANYTLVVEGRKCLFHPNDMTETTKFTISSILCGYGIPSMIMLVCYAAILKKVFEQSRVNSRHVSIRFRRTVISVATVIVFYLFTWTPYWTLVIVLNIMNDGGESGTGSVEEEQLGEPPEGSYRLISKLAVFVHILPFLNSAFSPLVYIMLNRDIRNQYKTIQTRKDTTNNNNNGFVLTLIKSDHVIREDVPILPHARSV